MRNRFFRKKHRKTENILAAKRIAFLLAVCLAVYLTPPEAETALRQRAYSLFGNTAITDFLLKTALNQPYQWDLSPVSFFVPQLKELQTQGEADPQTLDELDSEEPEDESPTQNEPSSGGADASSRDDIVSTTMTGEGSSRYTEIDGIYFKNNTDYSLDSSVLSDPDISIGDSPQVLIIHTHGSESYTPDGDDVYTESDPSRTEDKNFNMVRIGDELAEVLESRGIGVIHDRELYDYPSYTGSYGRSLEAAKEYISQYPSIKIVLDIHRDALEGDGITYKTSAQIPSVGPCSQIMFVVGTDGSGLEHPNWRENLKFAAALEKACNDKYPTLARPITISSSRYNQHLTTGALIVEVGTNGNTLQESLTAIRLFGDAASDVLLSFKS